jgi:2,3-bisphosphoglycerate-dependent phosphoglycerate mutase
VNAAVGTVGPRLARVTTAEEPATATTTRLLLVRHGEAHVNLLREGEGVQLRDVEGLTERGRAQAAALRDRVLADPSLRPDVVAASTFPRAAQTGAIVAEGLGLAPVPEDDLQEWRIGEGGDQLSIADLERHWLRTEAGHALFERVPGTTSETYAEFGIRVGAMVERLVTEHRGRTVMVFTHGGVVDLTMTGLARQSWVVPPSTVYQTRHTAITEWIAEDDGAGARVWVLGRYNDDAHVRTLSD